MYAKHKGTRDLSIFFSSFQKVEGSDSVDVREIDLGIFGILFKRFSTPGDTSVLFINFVKWMLHDVYGFLVANIYQGG